MPKPVIRIGFDARMAGLHHAGIGRYAEALLREWLSQKSDSKTVKIQWHIFVARDANLTWLTDLAAKREDIVLHETSIRHYSVLEQIVWPIILHRAELDWLYVPHFTVPLLYRRPFLVTIHDLLWHEERDARATTLPPWIYIWKYWAYRIVSASTIKRARLIFVPTNSVRQTLIRWFGGRSGIVVAQEGVGDEFRSVPFLNEAGGKTKRHAPKKERAPYVTFVGSLYPHKNIAVVFKALRQLPQWKLHIVSARGIFWERSQKLAQEYSVSSQVEWLGSLTDDELIGDLQSAVALVTPSRSEGFGLPGIEALRVGTSVVASDIPVFHEVYSDWAHYFAPHDPLMLATILTDLHKHPPSTEQRVRAQKYADRFRWERMAKAMWEEVAALLA